MFPYHIYFNEVVQKRKDYLFLRPGNHVAMKSYFIKELFLFSKYLIHKIKLTTVSLKYNRQLALYTLKGESRYLQD
jgi:hypothetical protein